MATHVVTGGSGFVGSNIARMLSDRKEKVRIVDVWEPGNLPPNVEFFQASVTDQNAMERIFADADYVHHNAALVPLTKAGDDFNSVNVGGTKVVLDAAKNTGIKFLTHMSSSAIFGSPDVMPITNEIPMRPIEIYGQSKYEADMLVQQAMAEGQPCACVRPRTIVGNERLGIFEILFEWIRDNANIYVIGPGTFPFQFVHVDDLCEVSIQACLQEKRGLYNVGAEDFGTLREDLGYLIQHAGSRSRVKSLPTSLTIGTLKALDFLKMSPLAPWHYLTYHKPFYFDISPVQKELGWQPQYSNKQILTIAYDWFVNERDLELSQQDMGKGSIHKKSVKQGVLKILKAIS